ncbi:MAG TPA: hypothetical protein PLL28_13290 [Chitinophagales bacterium]|nr:hypothetical protein [Chitinophagales bacterium]HNE46607.1 hypothetical protein [Chitinophagales bacterium]HNF70348.1 hypothetical protein [Chitinophagales bacterium]HNJ88855.1 hypothetical protein [Chitinophagales bacterium]HNK97231.1 hypothetical protein [Chitinophagales bacterium]
MRVKLLSILFCFIAVFCYQNRLSAQLVEFGIGYTPSIFSGSEISSFDGGDVPTVNTVSSVENTLVLSGNMMVGIYYHLLHYGENMSLGAHYQATLFAGTMDGGYYDALMGGVDLPIMAEIRFGNIATESSTAPFGCQLGGGAMFTAGIISIDGHPLKLGMFKPAVSLGATYEDVGIQFLWHPGKYTILYDTNTGGIPRADFFKYHLTLFWYLGEL